MSINSIGSNLPIQVSFGGLGVGTETQYGVLYGNGSSPVGATSAGTAGYVLTSNGAAAPTYQPISSIPGGGAFQLIQTQNISSASTVVFNTGIGTFKNFLFLVNNIYGSISGVYLQMEFSTDGGSTWTSSNINGYTSYVPGSGGWSCIPSTVGNLASPSPLCYNGITTSASFISLSGFYYILNANTISGNCILDGQWGLVGSASFFNNGLAKAYGNPATNAFRFSVSSGNIASGVISLYGLSS